MEYQKYFDVGLENGSMVVVVPFNRMGKNIEELTKDLQRLLESGFERGYSYQGNVTVEGATLLTFELGHDFLKRLTGFIDTFTEETREG